MWLAYRNNGKHPSASWWVCVLPGGCTHTLVSSLSLSCPLFSGAVVHLGDQPVQVACPTCHQMVVSKVEYSAGLLTYLSCAGLFLCGWVGLYSYSSSVDLHLRGCAAPDVCSHLFQICFGMLSYSILCGPAQKCKTHLSHLQNWTGRLQTPVNPIWPFVVA